MLNVTVVLELLPDTNALRESSCGVMFYVAHEPCAPFHVAEIHGFVDAVHVIGLDVFKRVSSTTSIAQAILNMPGLIKYELLVPPTRHVLKLYDAPAVKCAASSASMCSHLAPMQCYHIASTTNSSTKSLDRL